MATHSSILAGTIPSEAPGRLQSLGSKRIGLDNTHTTTTNDYLNVLITYFVKPRCFQMMLEARRKHCIDY